VKDFFQWNKKPRTSVSRKKMMSLAKTYKDFPLINLPHALSDNLREVLVALILIEVFSEQIFGLYDHTFRMLRMPVMIIGASISQILFNRISSFRLEKKLLMPTVSKVFISLLALSIIPFSIIYFFGQPLFVFVFGDWLKAVAIEGADLCKVTSKGKNVIPLGAELKYFGEGTYTVPWVSTRKKKVELSPSTAKTGKPGAKGIMLAHVDEVAL
jgi:hypothetical protein